MQQRLTPPGRPRAVLAALAMAFSFGTMVSVSAQPAATEIRLPAQELGTALESLASQTGIRILYSPDAVKDKMAPALAGNLSAAAALDRLLANSGLEWSASGDAYAIRPRREPSPGLTELAPVTVTATRSERRTDQVPASVTVISTQDLERQHLAKTEDALKHVESVDFNVGGASPFGAPPMIRGIGGSFAGVTSSVLVDGMITDSAISAIAGRGGLDFLAPQDIERIEVYRGPASALYGPNVVGGVVNAIPKRWQRSTGAELNAEYGSHETKKLGAVVGTANEQMDIRLSAFEARSDGFMAKPDPDPWGDKDSGPRGWTDRKLSLNGALRPTDDQEIGFAFQQYRTKVDYVGGSAFQNSEKREGDAYTLSYLKELADGHRIQVKYRHLDLLQSWIDSDDGMGVGSRNSVSDTMEGQVDLKLSERNTLIFGASYQSADFDTHDITGSFDSTATADSVGVFVQDEHRFGDLTAIAGARFDRFSQGATHQNGVTVHQGTDENVFNPRLGLRYQLSPAASVYVSAGTAYMPANADMKYRGGSTRWWDNPDLKPEKSASYEVGINHRSAWGALRAAIYRTNYKDMISTMSVTDTAWPRQYVNIGKVTVDGLELGWESKQDGAWRPYANYAYTRSIIKENPADPTTVGKHVQRIAPNKLNLGLIYVPSESWAVDVSGRYVGERYFRDNNTPDHRASAYFVADAKISMSLPFSQAVGKWSAYFAVDNIFDRKYTVWEYEYADGRTCWLGMNARF